MKPFLYSMLGLMTSATLLAADASAEFKDDKERTSYALGVSFGSNLRSEQIEVNLDTVMKGITDALAGEPKLTQQEMAAIFTKLRTDITARKNEASARNKAEGEKWLAENAKKEGVVQLPSGLQYKIVQEGSGDSPKPTDEVSVKYTGKLINGEVFDSTDNRGGEPARFQLNRVIPGWTEGMQHMKEGAVYEFYIPANLAYGERGRPGIPGNSVLIFNVELLEVFPGATPANTRPGQPVTSDIIKVPSAEELKKGAQIEIIKPEDLQKEIEREKARKAAEGEE